MGRLRWLCRATTPTGTLLSRDFAPAMIPPKLAAVFLRAQEAAASFYPGTQAAQERSQGA